MERRGTEPQHIPLSGYHEYPIQEMRRRSAAFYEDLNRRRSVRHFSDRTVPRDVIENCLRAAGTAPSGANCQPWHFVVVSDASVKQRIRQAAEAVEQGFYGGIAPDEWLNALSPLGTGASKPFLEVAPYLIAVFAVKYGRVSDGSRVRHYYVQESAGIATGFLVAAVHHAGLASLTYTPSPMGFLNEILGRPANERAMLILAVGYPADDATVPDIRRKPLDEIATFI